MYLISTLEFFVLIVSAVIANGLLSLPQTAVSIGGSGGWIVVLAFGIYSLFQAAILVTIIRRFPHSDFIAVNQKILGRSLGSIVVFSLAVYFILLAGLVSRGITNFATTTTYLNTPTALIISIFVFLSIFAIYNGLEVIARVNIFLFIIKLTAFIILLLLIIPNLEWSNLLPLWERGTSSWLEGVLNIHSSYSGFIILAFLHPHLRKKKYSLQAAVFALGFISFIYTLVTILTVLAIGSDEVVRLIWPTFSLVGKIEYPINSLFMAIWVTSAFSVISSCIFIAVYSFEKLFKFRNVKHLLLPLGIIVICIALLPKSVIETATFGRQIAVLGIFFEWLLPLILMMFAFRIKNCRRRL